MPERGLVIAPRFEFDGTTLHFPGLVGIDPVDLRQYLLYWDRIDFPDNNLISIGNTPDLDFLISAGVLSRTRVTLQFSGNIGLGYVVAQLAAFEQLNANAPASWSIGQAGQQFFNPGSSGLPLRAIEVELVSALPVPPDSVSLADILEFKRRRADELTALRSALDELYLQVSNARDIPRAKDAAVARLERVLTELRMATDEAWPTSLLRSVRVELNIPNILGSAAAGAASAFAMGIPTSAGAAAGAVASALKFDIRQLMAPRLPDSLKDFAYVFHAERELK